MPVVEQLVVGGARHDRHLQPRDGIVVEDPPQCARRENVGPGRVDVVERHRGGAEFLHHAIDPRGVDIGHDKIGAGPVQLPRQVAAHRAEPLNGHGTTRELLAPPALKRRRLDGAEHPAGRDTRRIPRLGADAGHVRGFHVHEVHVLDGRAHILGRHIAAAQGVHEAPVRAEQHLAVRGLVVADDHRLAAAQIEAGHGVLVRHAAGEAQRVHDRLLVAGVVPEAATAKRRPQRGVVNGDDAAVATRLVVTEHDLLVAHLGDGVEVVHAAVVSRGGCRRRPRRRPAFRAQSRCAGSPRCLRRSR